MAELLLIALVAIVAIDTKVFEQTTDNYFGISRPNIVAYYRPNSKLTAKMSNYWRNRLEAVSGDHSDVEFAVSDADQFRERLDGYGLEFDWKTRVDSQPIVIAEDADEVRYLMDAKLDTYSLKEFVHQFKLKQLIPQIKSQPIPDNSDKAVKEVVGRTFKQMVLENQKNVFILMYANWCGHCKQVLPVWEQLGRRMADRSDVDILQIDLTLNEVHRPFKTTSYPTINWIASDDKWSPKKYFGDRTVAKFIQFIYKMSAEQMDRLDRNRKESEMQNKNEL